MVGVSVGELVKVSVGVNVKVPVRVMVSVGEGVRVAVGGMGDAVWVGGGRVEVAGSITGAATVPRSQASRSKGSNSSSLRGMDR
jgi:hypothetical protein